MSEENSVALEPVVESIVNKSDEKMVLQSVVNKVVSGAKKESYDKGYNDALEKLKTEKVSAPVIDESVIEKKVNDLIDKKNQEYQTSLTSQQQIDFNEKLKRDYAAKEAEAIKKTPDYISSLVEAGLDKNTQVNTAIAIIANELDNTTDVIYDLSKNHAKLSNLTSALLSGNEKLSRKIVNDISKALKSKNTDVKVSSEPLTSLKPSVINPADPSDRSTNFMNARMKYRV